jgi:hypothetical protein
MHRCNLLRPIGPVHIPPGSLTELEDDGRGCVFTLTGPADAMELLELPIAATAIIEVAH